MVDITISFNTQEELETFRAMLDGIDGFNGTVVDISEDVQPEVLEDEAESVADAALEDEAVEGSEPEVEAGVEA